MVDFSAGDLQRLTERVAYEYWQRRGCPLGSPEIDWAAAEKTVASSVKYWANELPLYSLKMEPYEGPNR
jgi:hypothetical protein